MPDSAPIQEPARGVMRERLDNWCEKGILVLVLAVLVFGPLATGAVRPLEFLIIQALTVGTVLLWLLRLWLKPEPRLLWPPICWTVVAFVIYAIIRYQQAEIEFVARQELIRILVYAFLFFITLNNFARPGSVQLLCFALIFFGMAISMYAIYQFATNSQYVWHFIKPPGYRNRGSGTYICPNHLAGFLEMLVPLGLTYSLSGRIGHLARVFLGYATVMMLAGIGVTVSRGGWTATTVALFALFVLLLRRRRFRLPAFILLVLLAATAAAFYTKAEWSQKRFESLFSNDSEENRIRVLIWKVALHMWRDYPWVGVGPGLFGYRFHAYRPTEIQLDPGRVHNDYVNILADWGVVGFSMVAASFALLLGGIFRTWKFVSREQSALGAKPSNRAAFVLGASIGLVAILIHSFTDFNMHVPANAILAVALMALLTGHLRYTTECVWLNPGRVGRLAVTFIGLAAISYLGQQGWRRAREYSCLESAANERFYTETKIDALKQAFAVERMNAATAYEIGEALRHLSWEGFLGYEKLATEAIEWFQRAARLNPFDPYNPMRIGMCLDWLDQHDEAALFFEKALKLDPNDYYVLAHQGWHFVQTGDYVAAKQWFERSLKMQKAWHKPIASQYLWLLERKSKEPSAPGAK